SAHNYGEGDGQRHGLTCEASSVAEVVGEACPLRRAGAFEQGVQGALKVGAQHLVRACVPARHGPAGDAEAFGVLLVRHAQRSLECACMAASPLINDVHCRAPLRAVECGSSVPDGNAAPVARVARRGHKACTDAALSMHCIAAMQGFGWALTPLPLLEDVSCCAPWAVRLTRRRISSLSSSSSRSSGLAWLTTSVMLASSAVMAPAATSDSATGRP